MKSKLILLLIIMILLSTSLIGCGVKEKVDEAINSSAKTTEKTTGKTEVEKSEPKEIEPVTEVSNDIKEQAKKEGVSVKELQRTLDGLAKLSAEKYGMTTEEYIAQTKERGETVLSEWQLASENMGMSITDIYQYEKARENNLTDEQKQTMQGMNEALKLAEAELDDLPAEGAVDVEKMLGIEGNDSGEIRVVTMSDEELKEAFAYEVSKVTQEYTDDYSIVFDYVSDVDIDELVEHFDELLVNTQEYMKIGTPTTMAVIYQGMINETMVYVEIDQSQGGMATVSTYIDISTKK
ncbi:hypothetical protein [Vallitalea guaymasensis]|uniref:hypothetical protein n=1 Tax=Vallitalea guaymasensis TaxID=1185412 RepID=UPI000DE287ED|nr:hypothetical protein [Vallitalea guaymasensis]